MGMTWKVSTYSNYMNLVPAGLSQELKEVIARLGLLLQAKVIGGKQHVHLAARHDEPLEGGLALDQLVQEEGALVANLHAPAVEHRRHLVRLGVQDLERGLDLPHGVEARLLRGLELLVPHLDGNLAAGPLDPIGLHVNALDVALRHLHVQRVPPCRRRHRGLGRQGVSKVVRLRLGGGGRGRAALILVAQEGLVDPLRLDEVVLEVVGLLGGGEADGEHLGLPNVLGEHLLVLGEVRDGPREGLVVPAVHAHRHAGEH
mmetsp:Transcript_26074/g.83187  ORF Transcript_26074/g.83187 Transcript_26074/m.83187 type:complete len:259 (+) Transcript_26074:1614-2390(+)